MKKTIATNWVNGLVFVVTMWFFSRLIIIFSIELIAPLLHGSPVNYESSPPLGFSPNFVPKIDWELFSHWDGAYYRQITTVGYDYANDGQEHSLAFFPLFPLVIHGLMFLGLPFEIAGTLVNNLAFLGALFLLFCWAKERYSIGVARWATAVLAWCPFSLFGTVVYTEGLFLLLTTAALRAFDKQQHVRAAVWGAMASATRATGITLLPAFLFTAWRERRPAVAYVAGLVAGTGLLLFSVYCAIRFSDPLGFAHAQRGWHQLSWSNLFTSALTFNRDSLNKVVMFFGGACLLWHLRAKLPSVAVAYGFCSLALIIYSGAIMSLSCYAYGIVWLSLALGILLFRHQRWGYALMCLFTVLLISYAIRFAWWGWVA